MSTNYMKRTTFWAQPESPIQSNFTWHPVKAPWPNLKEATNAFNASMPRLEGCTRNDWSDHRFFLEQDIESSASPHHLKVPKPQVPTKRFSKIFCFALLGPISNAIWQPPQICPLEVFLGVPQVNHYQQHTAWGSTFPHINAKGPVWDRVLSEVNFWSQDLLQMR